MRKVKFFNFKRFNISDPLQPVEKAIESIDNSIILDRYGPKVIKQEGELYVVVEPTALGKADCEQILNEKISSYERFKLKYIDEKKLGLPDIKRLLYDTVRDRGTVFAYDNHPKDMAVFECLNQKIFVHVCLGTFVEQTRNENRNIHYLVEAFPHGYFSKRNVAQISG
jgi:hypothetical protein